MIFHWHTCCSRSVIAVNFVEVSHIESVRSFYQNFSKDKLITRFLVRAGETILFQTLLFSQQYFRKCFAEKCCFMFLTRTWLLFCFFLFFWALSNYFSSVTMKVMRWICLVHSVTIFKFSKVFPWNLVYNVKMGRGKTFATFQTIHLCISANLL